MAREPRRGTFDHSVREVAEKEGWSERTARSVLKDGIANAKDYAQRYPEHQRREREEARDGRKEG